MLAQRTKTSGFPLNALSAAIAFLALPLASPVLAQDNAANGANNLMEEVVVTARKRQESLLEVPIAITTFGAQQIEDLGLNTIEDVQLFSPGFVFESFATIPGRFDQSPRFRGIDIDTGDPFRQTASIFVDGIFVVNGASGIALNDVERVEVIKGPQSALFGRNTYGGAVNYITKTPGEDFKGDISATVASRGEYRLSGGMDIPMVPGKLAARLSGFYHDKDGHHDNNIPANSITLPQPSPGKLGDIETFNLSGTLFATPTDDLSMRLRVAYFENDDGLPATGQISAAQANCGSGQFGGSASRVFTCGALNPDELRVGGPVVAPDDIKVRLASLTPLNGPRDEFGFDRQNLTITGQFDYNLTDTLTLSGLAGYSEEDTSLLGYSSEFHPSSGALYYFSGNDRQFEVDNQELRLSGSFSDNFIDWSIGASRFSMENTNTGGFIVYFGAPISATTPTINRDAIDTFGVFGSVIVNLSDQWSLTVEGRYQEDEINDLDNVGSPTPVKNSATFTNFLPRFIVDFQVTPETLLYASYSKGNLPGGFNATVQRLNATERARLDVLDPQADSFYDEEELDSYELGVKHGFADGRGSVSAAVFMMDRSKQLFRTSQTDPLINGGQTISYFLNRGESEIKGFEVEGNYALTDNLTLSGSLGHVNAEFTVVTDTVHAVYFGTPDAAGKKAPRFPEWSGSLSLTYADQLASGMPYYARIDSSYVGKRYADISNLNWTEAGTIVNVRLGVEPGDYKVELFATNLTDSDVPTGVGRSSDPEAGFVQYSYRLGLRDKRQVGLRVSAEF